MELRVVGTEQVVGSVDYANGVLRLTGAAEEVFAEMRRIVGDRALGEGLTEHGWSNGYLYLVRPA